MKVLTLVHNLDIGGIQRDAQNYAISIKKKGYLSFVCALTGGYRERFLREESIPVTLLDEDGFKKSIQKIKNWSPDIIHIHHHGTTLNTFFRKIIHELRKTNEQLIVIEKNVFSVPNYKDLHLFDVHIVLSKWMLWKWNKWTNGWDNRNVSVVIPNMVDENEFYPIEAMQKQEIRNQLGISKDDFVFGRIGQPVGSKWSEVIFKAFKQIALEDEKVKMLLIGVPDRFKQLIRNYDEKVQNKFIVLDTVQGDDLLRKYYGAMDVFVHAAEIGESFGNVISESMLCETPVITLSTPVRSNTQVELVGHNIGGLVAGNMHQFYSHMKTLLHSEEKVHLLGKNARQRIVDGYSIEKVEGMYISLLENLNRNGQFNFEESNLVATIDRKYPTKLLYKNDIEYSYADLLKMAIVSNRFIYRIYKKYRDRNKKL